MKFLFPLFLMLAIAWTAKSQIDTLKYDGMKDVWDGQLLAATVFPGEMDVVFNARFSPVEKCKLEGVLIGFSVVKFQPLSGEDTLVVWVYENSPVPPVLRNVEKTYLVKLYDQGFPPGNFSLGDPLGSAAREELYIPLNPSITFSPKRDFIIGIKVLSRQIAAIGTGFGNGFNVLIKPYSPEQARYGRYRITDDPRYIANTPVTETLNASLYIRAVVRYDPTLPNVSLTNIEDPSAPSDMTLLQNYPNPFTNHTTLEYSLASEKHIVLAVYDALGRHVTTLVDGTVPAGTHSVEFRNSNTAKKIANGLYFARLTAGDRTLVRQMLLMQ